MFGMYLFTGNLYLFIKIYEKNTELAFTKSELLTRSELTQEFLLKSSEYDLFMLPGM